MFFLSTLESDRESTSSSLTVVNERQAGHLLAVESVDPTLQTMPLPSLINPTLDGQTFATLTSPLPVPVKKVGRRGRPPKKDAKSRNRQGRWILMICKCEKYREKTV